MGIIKFSSIKNSEFLFTFYVFMCIFVHPLYYYINSIYVLLSLTVIVVSCDFILNNSKNRVRLAYFVIFLLYFIALFLWSYFDNCNYFFVEKTIRFVINGATPALLLINVKDFQLLLRYWCFFSILALVLRFPEMYQLISDPSLASVYQQNGKYMTLGFNLLNYVFTGLIALYYVFEKKWAMGVVIPLLIFTAIYGNKSASIIVILILLCAEWGKGNILKKIFLTAITLFVINSLSATANFILDMLEKFGVSTYSLGSFRMLFSDKSDAVIELRTKIWEEAIQKWQESPVFGEGIGVFETETGYAHAHNIFLEILVTFGVIGMTIFISLLLISFYRVRETDDKYLRICQLLVLVSWIFQMQVSLVFWDSVFFWVYFALTLYPYQENVSNNIRNSDEKVVLSMAN